MPSVTQYTILPRSKGKPLIGGISNLRGKSDGRRWSRRVRATIWLCAIALLGMPSSACPGEWTTYTSMRAVNGIVQTGDEVWCATNGGVLRFSLVDSTYTRYTNLDGLAGNTVLCAEADSAGNLWFGTAGDGLSKFDVRTQTFHQPFSEFMGLRINALLARNGHLFVGTDRGVSLFLMDKEEVKETYRQLGGLERDVEVLSLEVLRGKLWAGTVQGLAWADLSLPNLKDPKSWRWKASLGEIRGIADVDSTILACSNKGMYRRVTDFAWFMDGLAFQWMTAMVVQEETALAATRDKIYRRIGGVWTASPRISSQILSLCVASDGGLWVGTKYGGLWYLRDRRIWPLPPVGGPAGNLFTDLALDGRGTLWAASAETDLWVNGLYRFDGDTWTRYRRQDGLPSDAVVAVAVDSSERVWIATWGGGAAILRDNDTVDKGDDEITQLKPSNTPLKPTDSSNYTVVSDLCADRSGAMWMLNFISRLSKLTPVPTSGVVVLDGFPYARYLVHSPLETSMPSAEGTALAIDDRGLKWVATTKAGFYLLDDGGTPFQPEDDRIVPFSTESHEDMSSNKISDLAVDRSGVAWIATDNGINAVHGTYSRPGGFEVTDWRVYSTEDGLTSNVVTAVAVDSRNTVWVGTEAGLVQIGSDGKTVTAFTARNSGLANDQIRALEFDPKTGALWIGTRGGLSRLQTAASESFTSDRVRVYPNPMRIDGINSIMTFSDLPAGARIEILTLTGEPVCLIRPDETGGSEAVWDGMNEAGFYVGSGIYFYVVIDREGRSAAGKLAVVNGL